MYMYMYVTILSLVNCTTSSCMTTYLEQEDSFGQNTLSNSILGGNMNNGKY